MSDDINMDEGFLAGVEVVMSHGIDPSPDVVRALIRAARAGLRAEAERDALRAEVARLKSPRAVLDAAEALLRGAGVRDVGLYIPHGSAPCAPFKVVIGCREGERQECGATLADAFEALKGGW